MSLFLAKKQENTNQKKVKDLVRSKANKKCFDCQAKGPVFANTTIQTFVCARCSDLVREFGHRVKAISTSKFSGAELLALKKGGNAMAQKIWENGYMPLETVEPISDDQVRELMRKKYDEQKWLDRALLQSHKDQVRTLIAKSFNEDGLPIVTKKVKTKMAPGFSRLPLIADNEMNIMHDDDEEEDYQEHNNPSLNINIMPEYPISHTIVPPPPTEQVINRTSVDSQRSSSSGSTTYSDSNKYDGSHSDTSYSGGNHDWKHMNNTKQDFSANYYTTTNQQHLKLTEPYVPDQRIFVEQNQNQEYSTNPVVSLPIQMQTTLGHDLQTPSLIDIATTKVKPTPAVVPKIGSTNSFDSILTDLSGLKLEKTVRRATYTGGILAPSSASLVPTKSASHEILQKASNPSSMFDTDFFARFNQTTVSSSNNGSDQYAALRNVQHNVVSSSSSAEEKHMSSSSSEEEEDDEDPWQDFCSSSSFQNQNDSDTTFLQMQNEIKNVKPSCSTTPIVSVDLFSDLDPRSMFRKL